MDSFTDSLTDMTHSDPGSHTTSEQDFTVPNSDNSWSLQMEV